MKGMGIGADIGGTFTDVVAVDAAGGIRIAKVPSTCSNAMAPSSGC